MAGRKKVKAAQPLKTAQPPKSPKTPKTERFELPIGLTKRIQKLEEKTRLPYRELLQKWICQEEIAAEAKTRSEALLEWQRHIEGQLKQILRQVNPQGKTAPVTEEAKKDEKAGGQDYKQSLVAKISALKAQGVTLANIARQFNESGVATVSGTGKWHPGTVSQLLSKNAV
jgi:hypothetical protein